MEEVRPVVDEAACVACGECVQACQFEVMKLRKDGARPRGIGRCIVCGHCVAVCPEAAVSHPEMPRDLLRDLPDEVATGPGEMMELLGRRRSVRLYTEAAVSEEDLRALVDAAVLAPSGHNWQPWRFTFITDPARLDALRAAAVGFYEELLETLADDAARAELGESVAERFDPLVPAVQMMVRAHGRGGDRLLWGAPALGLVHSAPDAPAAEQSCVYAAANMMLAAVTRGLGTCLIGFLSIPVAMGAEPVIDALGLPEGEQMHVAMVIGHPALRWRRTVARREPQITFR